ncbi:MAG: type III pantothenate kinase [Candidatus Omnitrophica bacterium]|nr:type III pantothenate kinase [Candidatus Omnitrophota bacterium]
MLLAIDIGNTNVNFALIEKRGRIKERFSVPTQNLNLALNKAGKIKKIDKIIIVSVVPKALKKLERGLKKSFKNTKVLVVGRNIKVPLKCRYNKREIGQDRLITAFAAEQTYGLPILVIDFGTAVTFDFVSKGSVYLGGLIVPGIKMSLESLSERTAMLPKTYLKKTRSFIGKDTHSSIRGGMIYGYASLCEGMIGLFKKKVGKNIKVVATGGDATLISRYTRSMKRIDPNLSLKGLYLLSRISSLVVKKMNKITSIWLAKARLEDESI